MIVLVNAPPSSVAPKHFVRTASSASAARSVSPNPSGTAAPTGGSGQHGGTQNAASPVGWIVLTLAIFAVLGIAWRAAAVRLPLPSPDADPRVVFFRSPAWRFVQTALIGLLAVAAAWHTVVNGNPDTLTVTLLILVLMVTLVPVVEKIAFPGGGEIDTLKAAVTQDANQLRQDAANAQVVLATAAQLIAERQNVVLGTRLASRNTPAVAQDLCARVLIDTTATVASLLVPQASPPDRTASGPPVQPEAVRVTAWVLTRDGKSLRCSFCWPEDLRMLTAVLSFEEGDLAIRIFGTGQAANYQDLAETQRPPQSASANAFHGIAIIPMFKAGVVAGLLQVERGRLDRFDPVQFPLARALGALYASALL